MEINKRVVYIGGRPFFIGPDPWGVPALWRGLPSDIAPLCEATRDDMGEVAWALVSKNFK